MYKFWKWLFKLSRDRFKEAHLDRHKNDIKCPNCNEWFSISGVDYKHEHLDPINDECSTVKCGKCKHISNWNLCVAPCPILADERGYPIETKN